jgi:hypothetical protein
VWFSYLAQSRIIVAAVYDPATKLNTFTRWDVATRRELSSGIADVGPIGGLQARRETHCKAKRDCYVNASMVTGIALFMCGIGESAPFSASQNSFRRLPVGLGSTLDSS